MIVHNYKNVYTVYIYVYTSIHVYAYYFISFLMDS